MLLVRLHHSLKFLNLPIIFIILHIKIFINQFAIFHFCHLFHFWFKFIFIFSFDGFLDKTSPPLFFISWGLSIMSGKLYISIIFLISDIKPGNFSCFWIVYILSLLVNLNSWWKHSGQILAASRLFHVHMKSYLRPSGAL